MPIRPDLRHHYRTPAWFVARKAVRERAGDRCERCQAHNKTWVVRERGETMGTKFVATIQVTDADAAGLKVQGKPVTWIQCGCAHVDHDPANDALDNLRWLCRGCHLRNDGPQHKRTRAARKDLARPLLAEASI